MIFTVMKQEIKRLLMENALNENMVPLPNDPKTLIRTLPEDLKLLLFQQWNAKQNPLHHPEGNTFKHILIVLKRAYKNFPNDPNMILSALFHDLGKMDTYAVNPKTGQPTAHGHENKSIDYVHQFKDWIESIDGADINTVKYIVKNHMKVKPNVWKDMRDKKKDPIRQDPDFPKLKDFTSKLDGGGINLDKQGDDEYLDEDLRSNIKKGLAGAALATSMMGSPAMGSENPIKSKEDSKEVRAYGVSKSTTEIIARVKTLLGINKPISKLTKEELKSAYSRINMGVLKNDIESNFSDLDIKTLRAELDLVLAGDAPLKYTSVIDKPADDVPLEYTPFEYTSVIDKPAIDAIFKYIGRLIAKKPVAGKMPDFVRLPSGYNKSYPRGYIK